MREKGWEKPKGTLLFKPTHSLFSASANSKAGFRLLVFNPATTTRKWGGRLAVPEPYHRHASTIIATLDLGSTHLCHSSICKLHPKLSKTTTRNANITQRSVKALRFDRPVSPKQQMVPIGSICQGQTRRWFLSTLKQQMDQIESARSTVSRLARGKLKKIHVRQFKNFLYE